MKMTSNQGRFKESHKFYQTRAYRYDLIDFKTMIQEIEGFNNV